VRVQASIEIARSPADVWEVVADRANDPRWCRKVKKVESAGAGQWNVWHQPIPLRPAVLLKTQHIRAEAPTYLAMREEDDESVFIVEYRLTTAPAGTSLTQTSEFTWKKLPRGLQSILAYGVRRDVTGQLRDLKLLLETAEDLGEDESL
jgi:uncharacterized protein YndB with AHSA1/START domain